MDYIKKELPSYNLHMIKTDKFKSTYIEIGFGSLIKKENITISNFLSSILTYSTKKYNSKIEFSRKIEDLYAASIFSSSYRLGKNYIIDFNLRVLNDKYTEQGLFEKSIKFLKEVLFNPNVKNNEFDLTSFNIVKNNERSQIERFKEDQRDYSALKLLELYDNDAPFSYNLKGYIEDLEKITPSNLYDYYKEFIKCNDIDIFVIGDINFDDVEKIISENINFNNKKIVSKDFVIDYKTHRKKVQKVIESDNTNQAKLSIACSLENITKYEKNYVLNLYNLILGGSADSKFFKNIREKFSLCYYINSNANKLDNLLTISSGINKENFNKTLILINKEMADMRDGNFSEDDINKAKRYYISALESIEDSPNQIIASFYAIDKFGIDSIEQRKLKIKKVSKEEIISLANKVYIDTIFLLGGDKK